VDKQGLVVQGLRLAEVPAHALHAAQLAGDRDDRQRIAGAARGGKRIR